MTVFDMYFNEAMLDYLVQFFGLFPAGILLSVIAWLVSILVHTAFRWIRG